MFHVPQALQVPYPMDVPLFPWKNPRMAVCSKCGGINLREPQVYCHECHAGYMRRNRPKHSRMSLVAQMRANARAYANVYLRRGKLAKKPCERCQNPEVQMHHNDYSQPLQVRWLCRGCHLNLHGTESLA